MVFSAYKVVVEVLSLDESSTIEAGAARKGRDSAVNEVYSTGVKVAALKVTDTKKV